MSILEGFGQIPLIEHKVCPCLAVIHTSTFLEKELNDLALGQRLDLSATAQLSAALLRGIINGLGTVFRSYRSS